MGYGLKAGDDPFKSASSHAELRDEFGAHVTVVMIPRTRHALLVETPDAVADAIVGWARGLP